MTSRPLVSVIIPVYNAGHYLRAAVLSIIEQTYTNLEILIIDDGSTDECVHTIDDIVDPRISIFRQDNNGKAAAVNFALERIAGEYWALQDADDISYARRIESQLEAILADDRLAAVFVGNDLRYMETTFAPRIKGKSTEECSDDIYHLRLVAHDATGLYRRSATKELRMDPDLRIGQGVDYIFRLGEQLPLKVIPGCLYSHRVNIESTTRQNAERSAEYSNMVTRKACARRGISAERHLISPQAARDIIKRSTISYSVQSIAQLKSEGRYREAFATAIFNIKMNPFYFMAYKPLLRLAIPSLLRFHKQGR